MNTIELNGQSLSFEDIKKVAVDKYFVTISETAIQNISRAYDLILAAYSIGFPVYGLTTGVGLNKDRKLIDTREATKPSLDPEVRDKSNLFNVQLLRAHAAALKPYLDEETARVVMLIRLNTLLVGTSGCQPEVIHLLTRLLNEGITPLIPTIGSLGQGDITILSHIGVCLMGEGEVYYEEKRLSTSEVFEKLGIIPLSPIAKDALSILSANAYSTGRAVKMYSSLERLFYTSNLVYALSLEALNGNISPLLDSVVQLRKQNATPHATQLIKTYLKGSVLWDHDQERPLQDPLSYRVTPETHDMLWDRCIELKTKLIVKINTSDDNPSVIIEQEEDPSQLNAEANRYHVNTSSASGWIIPTANFLPLEWVLRAQAVSQSLAQLSRLSANRTLRLSDPQFTYLPRFLSISDSQTIGLFGAIQKVSSTLNTEVQHLSESIDLNYITVAGGVEDHATNAPLVVEHMERQIKRIYQVLGVELLHAGQAISLRKKRGAFELGTVTEKTYQAYRMLVPLLDMSTSITPYLHKAVEFLTSGEALSHTFQGSK